MHLFSPSGALRGERRSRAPPKPQSFAGARWILGRLTLRRCPSLLHIFCCAQQIGGAKLQLGEGEALGEGWSVGGVRALLLHQNQAPPLPRNS